MMIRRPHGIAWHQSVGAALSNLLNATILNGHPDQTFSSRLEEARQTGLGGAWTVPIRQLVNFVWRVFARQRCHTCEALDFDTERTYSEAKADRFTWS